MSMLFVTVLYTAIIVKTCLYVKTKQTKQILVYKRINNLILNLYIKLLNSDNDKNITKQN